MEEKRIEESEEVKRKKKVIYAIGIGILIVCIVMAFIFSSFYPLIFAAVLELLLRMLGGFYLGPTADDTANRLLKNQENSRRY